MELIEAGIHIIFRFLSYIGMINFFMWFEKLIHEKIFPKSWKNNIGYNSDLMHGITIASWIAIVTFVILVAINVSEFIEIDRCLDLGGSWDYRKEMCKK